MKAIGKGIHANQGPSHRPSSSLKTLSLVSNAITDDGCESLLKTTNKQLEFLNLSMNKVNGQIDEQTHTDILALLGN